MDSLNKVLNGPARRICTKIPTLLALVLVFLLISLKHLKSLLYISSAPHLFYFFYFRNNDLDFVVSRNFRRIPIGTRTIDI